jgi:hypothetical protein
MEREQVSKEAASVPRVQFPFAQLETLQMTGHDRFYYNRPGDAATLLMNVFRLMPNLKRIVLRETPSNRNSVDSMRTPLIVLVIGIGKDTQKKNVGPITAISLIFGTQTAALVSLGEFRWTVKAVGRLGI